VTPEKSTIEVEKPAAGEELRGRPLEAVPAALVRLDTRPGWKILTRDPEGEFWQGFGPNEGLRACITADLIDGKIWRHLSISRRARLPSYDELARARRDFLGLERPAYQVFPPSKEFVNFHTFCLHLWSPVDHDPFPDPDMARAQATLGLYRR